MMVKRMQPEIKQMLIPPSNKYARPGRRMNPVSITIHETGNPSKGADAVNHANYIAGIKKNVSWHYVVDDEQIVQCLPINEIAWHAGDGGSGPGNTSSIAIEICVNSDGDFEKAKENVRDLVQWLMNETGIKEIYPHKQWSGKDCPHYILKSGWNDFVNWLHVGFNDESDLEEENKILKEKLEEIKAIIER